MGRDDGRAEKYGMASRSTVGLPRRVGGTPTQDLDAGWQTLRGRNIVEQQDSERIRRSGRIDISPARERDRSRERRTSHWNRSQTWTSRHDCDRYYGNT